MNRQMVPSGVALSVAISHISVIGLPDKSFGGCSIFYIGFEVRSGGAPPVVGGEAISQAREAGNSKP
jgi:hypothetical protein